MVNLYFCCCITAVQFVEAVGSDRDPINVTVMLVRNSSVGGWWARCGMAICRNRIVFGLILIVHESKV
jgi:hypothetical protein